MTPDSWLPIGFELPDGAFYGRALHEGTNWQIIETRGGGRALLARQELAEKWVAARLVEEGAMHACAFGSAHFFEVSCGPSQMLVPLVESRSPKNKSEALAFAMALRATRELDPESPLQDAIYVEKFSRLLPSYGITSRTEDDLVLGYWLTGGARVSAKSIRRLQQMISWLGANNVREVVAAAGLQVGSAGPLDESADDKSSPGVDARNREEFPGSAKAGKSKEGAFILPGRASLEAFFNEHVVDIVRNKERYKALGIGFPSAIVLHGPPGCGKTFAIEQLVDYLGWPCFQIDASSVASPYIHETSRKVAEVFEKAMKNAPSVMVIDEMEAFLADRESGGGGSHHRVEEVAEFLRRIPEATKNEVLIVAMTNRIEMIDAAILRRGRFDHVIKVEFASKNEVLSLLENLLATLPKDESVDPIPLAGELAGRPLSDVAFVVREGARLSARASRDKLTQEFLLQALGASPSREGDGPSRRIGFV